MIWQPFRNQRKLTKITDYSNDLLDTDLDSVAYGTTADIYKTRLRGRAVAVKRFRMSESQRFIYEKHFLRELLIMAQLRHPHIAEVCGIAYNQMRPSVIIVWYNNGTIIDHLRKNPGCSPRALVGQIIAGLLHLKKHHVIHGDLKGDNVLIGDDGTVRIADFGLAFIEQGFKDHVQDVTLKSTSRHVPVRNTYHIAGGIAARSVFATFADQFVRLTCSQSGTGSARWMAPELSFPEKCNSHSGRKTFQSDVFSFGMLVYEIYSLCVPFHTETSFIAILNIVKGCRPSIPCNTPPDEIAKSLDLRPKNPTKISLVRRALSNM